MKITYRNHPVLKLLQGKSSQDIKLYKNDLDNAVESYKYVKDIFNENIDSYRSHVHVITKPFEDAVIQAHDKLIHLIQDKIDNDISDILLEGTYMVNSLVYLANIKRHPENNMLEWSFFVLHKQGYLIGFSKRENGEDITGLSKRVVLEEGEDEQDYIFTHILRVMALHLFKKYAEVETHLVKPNRRIKTPNYQYFNDTKINFTVLNSTWFTNLIRSEGFKVSGHFRLQPCGVEMKDRKLIWINDFEKRGYVRRAGKEINKEE